MKNLFALVLLVASSPAMAETTVKCLVDIQLEEGAKMFQIETQQKEPEILVASYENPIMTVSAEINFNNGAHVLHVYDKATESSTQSGGGFNEYGFLGAIHRQKGRSYGLYCFLSDQAMKRWMDLR